MIGYRIYFKRIVKRNKDISIVFIAYPGIGDCCIAMAYLDAFRNKINKKVHLIVNEQLSELVSCFKGYNEVSYVSKKKCLNMSRVLSNRYRWAWYDKYSKNYNFIITKHWQYIPEYLLTLTTLNALDITRDCIFLLSDSDMKNYQIPNIDTQKYNHVFLNTSKNILFNSSSDTMSIDLKVFESIIQYFKIRGYNLYTNCKDKDSFCFTGTKRLITNIFELYSISDRFDYIVSVRSGILDFLITKNPRQIVLYQHNPFKNVFNLNMWRKGYVLEMFYDDPKMIDRIDEYVKGEMVRI